MRSVVLAAALAAALGAPPTAGAMSAKRAGLAVSERVGASAASARAYWTPARMRAARPAGIAPLAAGGASARPVAAGAGRKHRKRARLATPVDHATRHATRAHGKVFFRAGGYNYQCSGTAVRAPSASLVLTAGHCAYFETVPGFGDAVRGWTFVPAYDRGRAPFGKWPATTLAAPAGWVASDPLASAGELIAGDSRYDVGAATVARDRGRSLGAAVGGVAIGFDTPRHHRYVAFGYPALSPFHGGREFACDSPYRGPDSSFRPPQPIGIACDMTAGASGGGWIDGRGRLASVTSYAYSNDPTRLYGPYFGTAIRSFYSSVRSG